MRVHVACSLITPVEVTGYKPDELGGDIEVTALKGTRFKRLPKILSLNVRPRMGDGDGGGESIVLTHPPHWNEQLQRYDFNYATLQREKLRDKVKLPDMLDMTPYIAANNLEAERAKVSVCVVVACLWGSSVSSDTAVPQHLRPNRVSSSSCSPSCCTLATLVEATTMRTSRYVTTLGL